MMNRPVEGLMNRGWSVRILHSRLGDMGLVIAARNMHLAVNRSMMNRPVEGLVNRGWSVRILHSRLGHMRVVRAARVNNTSGTSTRNMDVSFLLVAARNVHLTVNRSLVNRRISLCNTDHT